MRALTKAHVLVSGDGQLSVSYWLELFFAVNRREARKVEPKYQPERTSGAKGATESDVLVGSLAFARG
ncbi:hypothetical protein BV898_12860 [Hypsibius exemplaris]|uniref:Uncharacterized protein n=1 Tax=Hypsibius exemplaris TaxID=2072580 RepID=A0A1W0WCA0_HYPEX|nr:hypothetical protein BV898_12860 [Hypsibius exemplaris]